MSADMNGSGRPARPPAAEDIECVEEFGIVNEFAGVRIRKLRTRAGERLEIASLELGYSIRLDALALEALSWQQPETISSFLETPFGPDA
jgi:hypothetical protein